jgi:hypothetical protein
MDRRITLNLILKKQKALWGPVMECFEIDNETLDSITWVSIVSS